MTDSLTNVLNHQTPTTKTRSRQRILYCIGLPILSFGLGMGVARPTDQPLAALSMATGALLVAFALPTQDRP
jgi:hypothetical protein